MAVTRSNQRQTKDAFYIGTSAGSNAYTSVMYPEPLAWVHGEKYQLKVTSDSTAAASLNPNSKGAKNLMLSPTEQVGAGDLLSGKQYVFTYDSALDVLMMLSGAATGGGGGDGEQMNIDGGNASSVYNTIPELDGGGA